MKRIGKFGICLMLCLLMLIPSGSVEAAVKPRRVTLDKTYVDRLVGVSFKLKATVFPQKAAGTKIRWKSSNKKIAEVNEKGRVTIKGEGQAVITARTPNGKTATCTVIGLPYRDREKLVGIGTPQGIRRYTKYSQQALGGYFPGYGCVTVATAIAASGFGKTYTPVDIHAGSPSSRFSECYAIRNAGGSTSLYGHAPISIRTAALILDNMGIPSQPVYAFTVDGAVQQMTAHLKKGNPVIVKANNRTVNGVRIANYHHALVLIGLDKDGCGIFIDPDSGRVNYAHSSGKYFHMDLRTFVANHMTGMAASPSQFYVTSTTGGGGGYILVGTSAKGGKK